MTDKEKFRKEVEKLKSNLIHGACASQIAMETMCKEEAYNEVLAILDSLQEEPVTSVWHNANILPNNPDAIIIEHSEYGTSIVPASKMSRYKGAEWAYIDDILNHTKMYPRCDKEEPVSEDLEEAARDILNTYEPIFSSSTSNGEPIEYYSPGQMRTIFMKGSYWQKEHCLKGLMNSDLETAANKYAIQIYNMFIRDETTLNDKEGDEILSEAFIAGAKWQEEQDQSTIELAEDHAMLAGMEKMKEEMMANIWRPADGVDLPEYEREVVVFTQNFPDDAGIMSVAIGHRPNPYGWDGKSLSTGKVEHYTPKTYGKGGWNIPDIVYWLDIELPKEIEL